ncbi:MAG TPA: phage holin family protein [Gaiellaceae bacterium]|nr:phage holin family protein [Gaiellaceae bacterium]
MPTHAPESSANGGVGAAAKQVADHATSIAKLELELAVFELKKKVAALGIGIGLGLGAALFGLFMLGFALATVAAVLATFLATWLALLIVTGGLALLAAILAAVAVASFKRASPPVPKQAIREAKLTTEAIKK